MSDRERRIRLVGGILAIVATLLLLVASHARPVQGQEPEVSLTLEEALALARTNNPGYLSQANDQAAADWAVRESFFNLLPQATARAGAQYVDAGTQVFGVFTGDDIGAGTTDYYLSDYALSVTYQLDGSTFARVSRSRADQRATSARIRAAEFTLGSEVTRQYLTALRARDQVSLATRQLERATENFELVSARVQAGAVVATDGKQAEVERGRAEVELLRAENLLRAEKHRLMEQIGIVIDAEVQLASEFEVFEPVFDRDDLVARAMEAHPLLGSYEAAEGAASASVWEARSSYLPSLFASASWSGFTREIGDEGFLLGQARGSVHSQRSNCELMNQISSGLREPLDGYPLDCSVYVLTATDEAAILRANQAFPFDYTQQPLSLRVQVSVPVFQGFTRQRQVEEAKAFARDARESRRAEELRLRTAVNTAFDDLLTAHEVVGIEERNRQVADQQLSLARERYRLGAAAFLEFLEAQSSLAQAERDYLNAVYDFHNGLSALEAAVGARLMEDGSES